MRSLVPLTGKNQQPMGMNARDEQEYEIRMERERERAQVRQEEAAKAEGGGGSELFGSFMGVISGVMQQNKKSPAPMDDGSPEGWRV